MDVRDGLFYSKEHEWVRLEDEDIATVGITDYAQDSLGDVVYVDLPEVGREVSMGESVCVVESVKAASDVFSPVGGQIIEVNENLSSNPELVNSSPYDEGWFFKVKLEDKSQIDTLMSADEYRDFINQL